MKQYEISYTLKIYVYAHDEDEAQKLADEPISQLLSVRNGDIDITSELERTQDISDDEEPE